MSYILDALRKSDQQRQRGAVPTLRTAPAVAMAPKQPAYLLYALLAAILLGSGIGIGWWRPWQPEQDTAPQTVAAKPAESSPRETAPVPSEIAREPMPVLRPLDSVPAPQFAPAPARAPMEARPPEPLAGSGLREQRVMTIAELPASLQSQIPKITITVHAYSAKPAERLVGINDRLLREGDSLEPDLRVEQITPDGMILSYKGTHFRHGVR